MTRLVFIIFSLVLGTCFGHVATTCEKGADGSCAALKSSSEVTVLLQGNMKVDEQLALASSQEVKMKVTGDDSCQYANDGSCDVPTYCSVGTDCSDCKNCGGSNSQTTWLGGCIQQQTVGGSCNIDMSQCQTPMKTTCGGMVWTIPLRNFADLPSIWCGTCEVAGVGQGQPAPAPAPAPAVQQGQVQQGQVQQTQGWDASSGMSNSEWAVLGGGSMKYSDIEQGYLGDCYFLAALSSIAHTHPEIIKSMFIKAGLTQGAHPVYTTRWLLNGKPTTVAVNNMIPADPTKGLPYFVTPKGGNFWPSVLEKAWAKIFGNYKIIEAGGSGAVFKAITQAPVENYVHAGIINSEQKKTNLWNKLVEGTSYKYPMGGGTSANPPSWIGVVGNHAYAILGAAGYSSPDGRWFARALHMYNPHHNDRYKGTIPNADKNDGTFHITLDEYLQAYASTYIAKVIYGAKVSATVIKKDTTMALEFTMYNNDNFAVQLEWPSYRSCGKSGPNAKWKMLVAKQGNLRTATDSFAGGAGSNARADISAGGGKYYVFVRGTFDGDGEMVVNVYSKEAPTIQVSSDYSNPNALFQAMTGSSFSTDHMGWGGSNPNALIQVEETNADTDIHESTKWCAAAALARMKTLDNGEQIAANGYDSLFPEVSSSLCAWGETLGDTASGQSSNGGAYNHWMSIPEIRRKTTPTATTWLAGGCIKQIHYESSCNLDMSQCQSPMTTTCGGSMWTIAVVCGGDCQGLPLKWCGTCTTTPAR